MYRFVALGVLLIGSAEARADWLLIDDFEMEESLPGWQNADVDNQTDPKVENPQVTEIVRGDADNQFLIKKPAAEGIVGNRKALSYLALPAPVPVGETWTFYTRINVEYFPNNHVFGITNQGPDGIEKLAYDALEPSLRVTDKWESDGTTNDGALMVRLGGGYANIRNEREDRSARPMSPGTWYEVWYVVNNDKASAGGQTYDVYVRGGDEFPEQQKVFSNADFRMKRELPLTYFMANCNTGPADRPYGNGGLRYDDLYMAPGLELGTPGNEHGAPDGR